jgi:hypothetical protein
MITRNLGRAAVVWHGSSLLSSPGVFQGEGHGEADAGDHLGFGGLAAQFGKQRRRFVLSVEFENCLGFAGITVNPLPHVVAVVPAEFDSQTEGAEITVCLLRST